MPIGTTAESKKQSGKKKKQRFPQLLEKKTYIVTCFAEQGVDLISQLVQQVITLSSAPAST